jgi:hypothetical protein
MQSQSKSQQESDFIIPALGRLRQEVGKLEARLGYLVRPSLKRKRIPVSYFVAINKVILKLMGKDLW